MTEIVNAKMTNDMLPPEARPYACPEPGCEARYVHPQHLGLHRYHQHGTLSERALKKRANKRAVGKPLTDTPRRTYTARPKLSAKDVCITVLKEVAPNGRIPIEAIPAYSEWVTATETFLTALNKKPS